MSNSIWQRLPIVPGLRSLEMKDHLEQRVLEDTRGASRAALVAYFREAARRFRREVGRANPESVAGAAVVRDADRTT